MGTAAEFYRPVTAVNHSYSAAVLFTEQCHSTGLLCFFHGHFSDIYRIELVNCVIYQRFNFSQLFLGYRFEMREVKTQDVFVYRGTRLLYVSANHFTQSLLQ